MRATPRSVALCKIAPSDTETRSCRAVHMPPGPRDGVPAFRQRARCAPGKHLHKSRSQCFTYWVGFRLRPRCAKRTESSHFFLSQLESIVGVVTAPDGLQLKQSRHENDRCHGGNHTRYPMSPIISDPAPRMHQLRVPPICSPVAGLSSPRQSQSMRTA